LWPSTGFGLVLVGMFTDVEAAGTTFVTVLTGGI
jgi:hypothetical protein